MKWLRPKGALGFLAVSVALLLFWYLAADPLLKAAIESGGSRIVGAKVELKSADLTFSPLGFQLKGLQVADPDQPMQNLIQLERTGGGLRLIPLLTGQVIIDELEATGIRFNAPRKTSGALPKEAPEPVAPKTATSTEQPAAEDDSAGMMASIKESLPSADELLDRTPLSIHKKSNALKEGVAKQQEELKQAFANLPDKQHLADYEKRLKEIVGRKVKSLDELKQLKADLEALKQEIRTDKANISQARSQIKNAKQELSGLYDDLKQARKNDLETLRSQYSLDGAGAGNISGLIFGDTAKEWLGTLQGWSKQLQRVLPEGGEAPEPVQPPRSSGRFIHFGGVDPLPDFLIRKAVLQIDLPVGGVEAVMTDITHQPQILGRPMRLQVIGEQLAQADRLQVDGLFDHVHPQREQDSLKWSMSGWRMQEFRLAKRADSEIALQQARVNINGGAQLRQGQLSATTDALFNDARWSGEAGGLGGQLLKSLKEIQQFNINGNLSGRLTSPKLSLSSDLDNRLKQAMNRQLQQRRDQLEKELQARLNGELEKAAGPYKEQLAALTQGEGDFKQRTAQLESMLKAELQNGVEDKKQEAVDKLKDKLKRLRR